MTDMTEPTHHLTPQLLMAYSAGTLPEAFDLIVASHVSLCDTCRAELASYDAVGGALLEALGPAPVLDGVALLSRARAREHELARGIVNLGRDRRRRAPGS